MARSPAAAVADSEPHRKPSAEERDSAAEGADDADADARLRKPVNTLAIVPKSQRITSLGRKAYNVLLHEAQEQGLDRDVFSAPLDSIVRGVDFDSNDHELIKKHLRAMVSTTVEWQSPTTGEGSSWNVSGLLAHARLGKVRGQVWVEWSYAVNLKQELLQPTVFARLSLEIISQLRSHAAIALYEICSRYKNVGRTSRQAWQWWRPVLSGRPENERTARLEYRIFKRDTLKPAIAEVCAITDIEVELVEHRDGRFIADLQFLVRTRAREAAPARRAPEPVDLAAVAAARSLGVDESQAEQLIDEFGGAAFDAGLAALRRRADNPYPEVLREPHRYLKALLAGERKAARVGVPAAAAAVTRADAAADRAAAAKRQARSLEEWMRRRREQVFDELVALPADEQQRLSLALLHDMEARGVHPSIRKRLGSSGWQHSLVVGEMIRFYARATIGEAWDCPSPEELRAAAGRLDDAEPAPPARGG